MPERGHPLTSSTPEAPLEDIKRTGPPVPTGVRGSEYELTVALNATPSRAWRRLFEAPDEWTEPCHPSRITVKARALVFSSEEARVPMWIDQIDKWIAAANRKCAEKAAAAAPPGDGRDPGGREQLRELTDRLRSL